MSECKGHKYSKFCQFSLQISLSIFPFRFSLPRPKPKFFFTGTWAGRECFSVFFALEVIPALSHRCHQICLSFSHFCSTNNPVRVAPPPHCIPAILDGRFLLSGQTLSFYLECHPPFLSIPRSSLMLYFLSCHFPQLRHSLLLLSIYLSPIAFPCLL